MVIKTEIKIVDKVYSKYDNIKFEQQKVTCCWDRGAYFCKVRVNS